MKVRIGVCVGQAGVPDQFGAAVDALEAAGVGFLWLPEMVCGSLADPSLGLAHPLARTSYLKEGTGGSHAARTPPGAGGQATRHPGPARPARRPVLAVFGLKPAPPTEQAAFPVPWKSQSAVFDKTLTFREHFGDYQRQLFLMDHPACR